MNREAVHVRLWRPGPLGLVPAAPDDPFSGLGSLGGSRNHRDNVIPALRFAQVEAHAELADSGEVAVTFDESGDGEPSLQVDNSGFRPGQAVDFSIAAHGRDPVATDRDGLHHGRGGLERH